MFEKYIVNLKNIIFFKIIIYFLITIFLVWATSVMNEELVHSTKKNNTAIKNFSETTIKLYALVNAGQHIVSDYQKYEKILDNPVAYYPTAHYCALKNEILNAINLLAKKYNLPNQVKVEIAYLGTDATRKTNQIIINNYDVHLEFRTPDLITFLNFAKNVYEVMPANSFILSLHAERKEVIDLALVQFLSPSKLQNLIYSTLILRVRELVAAK